MHASLRPFLSSASNVNAKRAEASATAAALAPPVAAGREEGGVASVGSALRPWTAATRQHDDCASNGHDNH